MSKRKFEFAETGGKGHGLQQLEALSAELDFKVPEYDIVPPRLFTEFHVDAERANTVDALKTLMTGRESTQNALPGSIETLVRKCAEKYKGRKVQVRSNSKREGGSHSFRGRYDSVTVERVDEASLCAACWSIYNSLYSERAVAYRLENNIPDDEMGIVIQEFIDGEWYGVVHTSKSDYPAAIAVNFSEKHGDITEGQDDAQLKEYVKTADGPQLLFEPDITLTSAWDRRLACIAQDIEGRLGHSELEFAIRDDEIYLLQRDQLRNIQQPVPVDIPSYAPSAHLGETYMAHGHGSVTLPVVRIASLDETMKILSPLQVEAVGSELIGDWIRDMQKLDAQYQDGYALVTTHFNETMFCQYVAIAFANKMRIPRDSNFDTLTPHKKMIITTALAAPSCHAITIAREKGIFYAGFMDRDDLFDAMRTGERVSTYFTDGKAILYKEATPKKSIQEFGISAEDLVELKLPVDSNAVVQSFGESLAGELSALTNLQWSYEPNSGLVGGILRCENSEYDIGLSGHRMANRYTVLRLDPECVHTDIKPAVERLLQRFC